LQGDPYKESSQHCIQDIKPDLAETSENATSSSNRRDPSPGKLIRRIKLPEEILRIVFLIVSCKPIKSSYCSLMKSVKNTLIPFFPTPVQFMLAPIIDI
jgi:hypothetical protein